ncbi:hypothetical protein K501DRAFT_289252 [Backusella circina FSU 941]|nr:hypothetical protein K501DRAFT_289252 [Backusella circina FSU 941]
MLPTEILFRVFDFLPISQLYRIGKVSTRLRQLVPQYNIFQDIAKRAYLKSRPGESYYTLCLAYSKQICELCGFLSRRDAVGSSICLPVIIESDDIVLSLCLPCRKAYYKSHPEPTRPLPERQHIHMEDNEQHLRHYSLPMFTAMIEYALTRQDLANLNHAIHVNPAPSVRYYIESEVAELARSIHGGDVGIYQEIASSLLQYRINPYQIKSCSRDRTRRRLVAERAQEENIKFIPESGVFIDYVLFGRGSVKAVLQDMQRLNWLYKQGLLFLDTNNHLLVKTHEQDIIKSWVTRRIQQGNFTVIDTSECPECLWETLEKIRIQIIKQKLKERVIHCVANLWDGYQTGELKQMALSREQFLAFINMPTVHCSCLLSDSVGISAEDLEPVIELSSCVALLQPVITFST